MGWGNLIPKAWKSKRHSASSAVSTYSSQSGPIYLDTNARQYSFSRPSSRPGSLRGSPERFRHDSLLGRVQEEGNEEPEAVAADDEVGGEEDLDWELEQIGMYRGTYTRLVSLYTIVPLASAALLLLIAFIPRLIWPLPEETTFPSPPNFPFPFTELLLSIALWSLAHIVHVPIYTFFAFLAPSNTDGATLLATTTHVVLTNLLRLSAMAILQIRHRMEYYLPTWQDPAFQRIILLAVGWSTAEVVVGVWQGYEMIGLYKDVLVPEGREGEVLEVIEERAASPMGRNSFLESTSAMTTPMPKLSISAQVDQDLDRLAVVKAREEVEEVYGMPAVRIPVFISTLQRLNSIFFCLGFKLLLGSAYLSSSLSFPENSNSPGSNLPIALAFPLLTLLHISLSVLHTPLVLPRIGLHTAAYVGLIVGLGSVFAGLAVWGALS